MMCGIDDAMVHANIIARGGFNQLEDLRVLGTDTDVTEMAKRMAAHTLAEGQVLLGTVIIKHLQMLVWWMRDHQKRGLPLVVANFNAETMNQASEMKSLRHELADKEPSVAELGKFDPKDFDAYKDAFLSLMGCYMRPGIILYDRIWLRRSLLLMRNEECTNSHLWENPLNWIVKRFTANRKAFLINSPGRAWIEPHNMTGNGMV